MGGMHRTICINRSKREMRMPSKIHLIFIWMPATISLQIGGDRWHLSCNELLRCICSKRTEGCSQQLAVLTYKWEKGYSRLCQGTLAIYNSLVGKCFRKLETWNEFSKLSASNYMQETFLDLPRHPSTIVGCQSWQWFIFERIKQILTPF